MAIQDNFKRIDYDRDLRKLEPGSTLENWNSHLFLGAITNVMGNVKFANPFLPAGDNTIIGAYEDEKNSTIITFNSNSNNNHGIYRYFPDRQNNKWEVIKIDPLFNFQPTHYIIDVNLVGDLLYWHEDIEPPRKLDISKANNTNKAFVFNLYFGDGKTNPFFVGTSWAFSIVSSIGTTPLPHGPFKVTSSTTFADALIGYASFLGLNLHGWTITQNGSFITVQPPVGLLGEIFSVTSASTNNVQWAVLQNAYSAPMRLNYMEVIKYPPHYPINANPRYDSLRDTNNIQGLPLQFRYQYIYDNNEVSVWSPYSLIALDGQSAQTDLFQSKVNCVDLDYSDDGLLFTDNYRNAIKKVALSFRIGNTGKETQIIILEQFELTGLYTFYNDGLGAPISDAEVAEPYHAVPLVVGAQEIAKDRLYYADNTEGYDEVPVDADFSDVEINDIPNQDTWTVVGYAVVYNNLRNGYDSVFASAIDGKPYYGCDVISGSNADRVDRAKRMQQYLGTSGFTVYLAGTQHFATTIQITDSGDFATPGTPWWTNPFSAGFVQAFAITGVEGNKTYRLRFASNYCGPSNQFGNSYNTSNKNLEWQKTSMPLTSVGGNDSVNTGIYEIEIVLGTPPKGGGTYDITDPGTVGTPTGHTYAHFPPTDTSKPALPPNIGHASFTNKGYSVIIDSGWYVPHGGLAPFQERSASVWGYLVYDTLQTNGASNMPGALQIEGQKIILEGFAFGWASNQTQVFTDHNGFFWTNNKYDTDSGAGAYISPQIAFTAQGKGGAGVGNIFLLNNGPFFNGNKFDDPSTLHPAIFESGAPQADQILSPQLCISSNDNTRSIILFATDFINLDSIRTNIKGHVNDQFGANAPYIPIVFTKTGVVVKTDFNGDFSFPIFELFFDNPGRTNDFLIIDGVKRSISLLAFTGFNPGAIAPTFDSTHPFTANPINGNSVTPVVPFIVQLAIVLTSALKRGGMYPFGIVYFDEGDRKTAVCTTQKNTIYIPAQSQDLGAFLPRRYTPGTQKGGQPLVHWSINNPAPDWATHYAIVRATDQNINRYVQIVICGALYLLYFDTFATDPLTHTTTFGTGEATQIYIDINSLLLFTEENTYAFSANDVANNIPYISYVFQKGDRLQLILDDSSGTEILLNKLYDIEIKGQYKNYIIIDFELDLPEIVEGMLIQIYTPKKDGVIKTFYEIGETYPILTDGNGRKYHVGPDQTQDITLGKPAKGTIKHGDTYFRKRNMPTINTHAPTSHRYILYIEDPSISDFFDSYCSDIGRVNIIDKDFKQTRRNNGYRFSDKIILGTNTNGLSAFHQLNNGTLDAINGNIVHLAMLNYVMLAIQEFEVTSMYIETQVTYNAQENKTIISISDEVVNNKTPLLKEQGSQDKGSIIKYQGRVYFWNRYKATYNRYSDNGITIVSSIYSAITFFQELSALLNGQDVTLKGNGYYTVDSIHASSVFDRINSEALLTVNYHITQFDSEGGVIDDFTDGKTIAFFDWPEKEDSAFTTRYSFIPKVYSQNHNNIVSFFSGDAELYEHEQNPVYGEFYGSSNDQKVTLVFADMPALIKFYKSVSIHSNNRWRIFITTPPNDENPNGQRSELAESDFEEKEGNYDASFFQNMDTPNFGDQYEALANGEPLRGYAIILELVNSATTKTVLYAVAVSAGNSALVLT